MTVDDGPALRWAVDVASWEPSKPEWRFLGKLIGAEEQHKVDGVAAQTCRFSFATSFSILLFSAFPIPYKMSLMVWQVEQFRRDDDKKRAIISRLLKLASVHHALKVPWEEVTIRYCKGKKPYYWSFPSHSKTSAPNFNFNVSHEVPATRFKLFEKYSCLATGNVQVV